VTPETTLDVKKIVIPIRELPTLPGSAAEILRKANDPQASIEDIEAAVRKDQGIVLGLLKVVNSATYGFRRVMETPRDALVGIGLRKARAVVSALSVGPFFDTNIEGVDGARLWAHSLATGLWAERLAKRFQPDKADVVFTAGLMHDVGLVVLATRAPDLLSRAVRVAKQGSYSLYAVEKRFLGATHARFGAALCAAWNLPPNLTLLVSEHDGTPQDSLGQILQLAGWIASACGFSNFDWENEEEFPTALLTGLGLNEDSLGDYVWQAGEISEELEIFKQSP
jgi:HD-like signal output (HDOD) protein